MSASPIDHWSYSSLTLFMRNRLSFKKAYILKQFDDPKSPSSVVGSAGHKALEAYYNGMAVDQAIEVGMKHIQRTSDAEIDFGKTGSREKMMKEYTQAINFYFAEMKPVKVLGVEKSITKEIKDREGNVLALPAKAKIDLVAQNENGELEIIDHKFVRSFSDGLVDDPAKIIQGMFNYHTIEAEYGVEPARIIYRECKISANKDGSPQVQDYVVEFDRHEDFALFYNIYNDCTREILKPDVMYLPNFQDMFDGQNSFEIYRSNIIGVDAPVAVDHKAKQVDFIERTFVQSAVDKVENKHLTPEEKIRMKFAEFGIPVEMQETHVGASITQYTLKPSRGVRMSQFDKFASDIALALESHSIRIEAPIRGTALVGIEVPSTERKTIDLTDKELVAGTMNIPIGVNVYGHTIHKDLTEMPHLLVAGATGTGKSVFLNVVLTALTKQMTAEQMKLILIDPKRVELAQFKNTPHLLSEVIYSTEDAATALEWLNEEMERRYTLLEQANVRSIDQYNGMDKIVVVIDEFADLMLSGGQTKKKAEYRQVTKVEHDASGKTTSKFKEKTQDEKPSAEHLIVRLAQKARAVGIHLILATQRPSADVVTGLLKANIPTKVAFMTTSKTNSQIVLDEVGAEELTGKGDMLFLDPSKPNLQRLQGYYA